MLRGTFRAGLARICPGVKFSVPGSHFSWHHSFLFFGRVFISAKRIRNTSDLIRSDTMEGLYMRHQSDVWGNVYCFLKSMILVSFWQVTCQRIALT